MFEKKCGAAGFNYQNRPLCVPSKDFLLARDGPHFSEIFREGLKAKVGSWDHRKFDDDV